MRTTLRRMIVFLGILMAFMAIPAAAAADYDIADAAVMLIEPMEYTGEALKPKISASFCGIELKEGTDYTLAYQNNTAPGIATVTVTGKGIFAGSRTLQFVIERADIANAVVEGITDRLYTGSAHTQNITLTRNGRELVPQTDYEVHYYTNTTIGTARMLITGLGNYTGYIAETFDIATDAKPVTVSVSSGSVSAVVGQEVGVKVTTTGTFIDWTLTRNGSSYALESSKYYSGDKYNPVFTFTSSGSYVFTHRYEDKEYAGYVDSNGVYHSAWVTKTFTQKLSIEVTNPDTATVKTVKLSEAENDGVRAINLFLSVTPKNAVDANLTWSSSDSSVAEVNQFGRVTLLSAGSTNIKATTAGGVSLTIPLDLAALNLQTKGDILGVWQDENGKWSVSAVYNGNTVLTDGVDYEISNTLVDGGKVRVTIRGKGLFGGSRTETFAMPDYTVVGWPISVQKPEHGTVQVNKTNACFGDKITVTTTADTGYVLETVLVDGAPIEGKTFIVKGSHTVSARFVSKNNKAWDGVTTAAFTEGDGTASNPYRIYTAAQLAYLAKLANDSSSTDYYYELMADIDLGDKEWTPIGLGEDSYGQIYSYYSFEGNFDGNGHVIRGLNIQSSPKSSVVGLFGLIYGGSVTDLVIEDPYICYKGYSYENEYTGALAGSVCSGGKITSCVVNGGYVGSDLSVKNGYKHTGGLVGMTEGSYSTPIKLEQVASSAEVSVNNCAGGLIGYAYYTDVTNGMASGDVSGSEKVGGFVGYSYESSYTSCMAQGNVQNGVYIGGFIGYASYDVIKYSYCTGTVHSGTEAMGGFIGGIGYSTELTNCWSESNVCDTDSATYVGGLVGYNKTSSAGLSSYCLQVGEVETGAEYVGSAIGYLNSSSSSPSVSGFYTVNTLPVIGNKGSATSVYTKTKAQMADLYFSTLYVKKDFENGGFLLLSNDWFAVDSISVLSLPDKLVYTVGEEVDLSGLEVEMRYKNGLACTLTEIGSVSADTSKVGTVRVEASAGGKSFGWDIEVTAGYRTEILQHARSVVYVDVYNVEDCILVVAAYNKSGKFLGSAVKQVNAFEGETFVICEAFDGAPVIRAYLLDSDTMAPLV